MCHTLISFGDNCLSTCGCLLVALNCLKPIVTQSVRFRDVSEGLGELGSNVLPYFFYKWTLEVEGNGFNKLGIQISLKISEEKKKGENQGRGASVILP